MFWQALDPRRSNLGLVLGYTALGTSAGLLFIVGLLYWVFHNNRDMMVRDGLFGQAEEIAEELTIGRDGDFALVMHEPMQWAYDALYGNLKYRVLDESGAVVLSSESDHAPLLPAGWADKQQLPEFFRIALPQGELAVGNYRFERDNRLFTVQAARSDLFSDLAAEAMMPAVFETATVLAVSTFAILLLATFLAMRAALARIRSVSAAADAIRPENLESRIVLNNVPLEIVPLVEAFNRALDRIAEGYRVQQRFVANAAHELKTPLTILRGRVELSADPRTGAELLKDIDGMARNVQQMLRLSQVQDIRNYRFDRVDLRAVAQEVERSFLAYPLLGERKLVIVDESGDNRLRADASAVFTALRNLVENAIHWSPRRGTIEITVLPTGYRVRDQGPGFEPAHRAFLFERFWRAYPAKADGSGLGLSIVAEIARVHGGKVDAALAEPCGSIFTLQLTSLCTRRNCP